MASLYLKTKQKFAQYKKIRAASLKANLFLEGPMKHDEEKRAAHREEIANSARITLVAAARNAGIASPRFDVRVSMNDGHNTNRAHGDTYVGDLHIDVDKRRVTALIPGKPDTIYPIEYVAKALWDVCNNMKRLPRQRGAGIVF